MDRNIKLGGNTIQDILGLSQKSYINKVLERFRMDKYSAEIVPIQKGDKFSQMQCPKNDLDWKAMELIPYASVVGSLMYAQTCTQPDISFAVGMLGDIKVILVWTIGKLQRKFLGTYKAPRTICSPTGS